MKTLITGGSGFIGTNFVEAFLQHGDQILNLDLRDPSDVRQNPHFQPCDLLQETEITRHLQRFQPEAVVHLAAQTDVFDVGSAGSDYPANTQGTRNLLQAVQATPSVQRLVITSSQLVCQPGHLPTGPDDYTPHTAYGRSKVETEKLTKAAGLRCTWTIIRPTNIWGPWHFRYRNSFLRVLERGLYFHPSGPCHQGFGYVGNLAHQVRRILELPPGTVGGQTLYVGDEVIPLLDWVNAFSRELRGRDVRIVPRSWIRVLARFGDLYEKVTGRKFVIYSDRYHNMTDDYRVPMEPTFALLGRPEISLAEGARHTVAWMRAFP